MSGFERILARVHGDALRSYCSSAIEDELRNLQTSMQTCLDRAEQALAVQDAVATLAVPLSRENAATCAEIRLKYDAFRTELAAFLTAQRQLQAQAPQDTREAQQKQRAQQHRDVVTKLLGKIQHRITRKRSDAWIDKNFVDVASVAELMTRDAEHVGALDKTLRNELVLVLDHLISSVLLSPLTTQSTLQTMDDVLQKMAGVHDEIDAYIRSSSVLLTKKRPSYALQKEAGSFESNNIVDAASEPQVKRQRAEPDELLVKIEQTAAAVAAAEAAGKDVAYEVFVSDLPWGTTREAEVASYFGIAGPVVSVQMPTMADGSTVGVAIVRFAALDGMTLAMRMDGYPYNGKNIRVAVHKSH